MQIRKASFMKTEQKELLVFLLVAFGIPLLMTIPLALTYGAGKDTTIFSGVQTLYPAAGLMLAKLICGKDTSLVPKKFFGGYLLLTVLFWFWCVTVFFLPDELAANGVNFLSYGGLVFLILIFEDWEKLNASGLLGGNWKKSFILLGLFLLLIFSSAFILLTLTTDMIVAGRTLSQMGKNLFPHF